MEMYFSNYFAENLFIININYVEFLISFFGLFDNLLLLYMLKYRKPFTPNVRLLFGVAAATHSLVSLWIAIKNVLVLLAIHFNFSVILSENTCFILAGIFYAVPFQFSALAIWLILIERLYASMKYKENAELSTKMIYVLLLIATIIALVVVLFFFVMARDIKVINLLFVNHCNLMYYGGLAYCIPIIFYFIGESVVLLTFIWIKHNIREAH